MAEQKVFLGQHKRIFQAEFTALIYISLDLQFRELEHKLKEKLRTEMNLEQKVLLFGIYTFFHKLEEFSCDPLIAWHAGCRA